MSNTIKAFTFDCADPDKLAQFWSKVLDYETTDTGLNRDGTKFIHIGSRQGGAQLFFEQVPEGSNTDRKNPLHLDIEPPAGQHNQELQRLLALGAQRSEIGVGADLPWVVLLDPEGNEFCLFGRKQNSPPQS